MMGATVLPVRRPPVEEPLHAAPPPVTEPVLAPVAGADVTGVLARITALLAPIGAADLERLRGEVARAITDLETVRDELRVLTSLKLALEA